MLQHCLLLSRAGYMQCRLCREFLVLFIKKSITAVNNPIISANKHKNGSTTSVENNLI